MPKKPPLVAIVGRPNVGKSTLFNRIIGSRDAIVDDQPGVTRDLKYRPADWNGKPFELVDTGGIFGPDDDPFSKVIQAQIERAVQACALIVFVLDGRDGPTPLDHEIFNLLRRTHKPILCAINKVDNPRIENEVIASFFELGADAFLPVSSTHGLGVGDLLDEIVGRIPDDEAQFEDDPPGIAILGRPNVGKSTLLNSLCGSERAIVSPIGGTTRDPVDEIVAVNGKKYLLIDTAGIRRRSKMNQGLDRYALNRNEKALDRCDLALLIIDGVEGLTETDAKVFRLAKDTGKAAMILVNKWDAIHEKTEKSTGEFAKKIREDMPFLHYAPLEFISALTKQRLHRIFPKIEQILSDYHFRASTSSLNQLMERIIAHNPPPTHHGRPARLYYSTQVSTAPPTFLAFVNDPEAIHFSYERYLMNQLYEHFKLEGVPLRLYFRKREREEK